jgi:Flp pilus assembly protein TadD
MLRECEWWPELLAFLFGSAVFTWFIAPGVLWMDVGELAAAAATLGGAPPPGHPGHSLLGKLACFLPIGEVATRLSFLSAMATGAMLAGLVRLIRVFFPSQRIMPLVAVLPIALAPGIVLNATRPEVYAPAFALVIWSTAMAVEFIRSDKPSARNALTSVFLLALAAGFHPAIALSTGLPIALGLVLASKKRVLRLLPFAFVLIALAAMLYLYLPSRALASDAPALVWGDPSSLGNLWDVMTASVYQGNVFQGSLAERFAARLALLAEGPGLLILLLGIAGLGFGALTQLRGAGTLLLLSLSVVIASALQSSFNPDMRAYLALALISGSVGLAILAMALFRALPLPEKRAWHSAVLVAPMVLMALWMSSNDTSRRDHSDDAMQLWDESVGAMPPGPGLFFASADHTLFVAWYERLVGGARPDIVIVNPELVRDRWFLEHLRGMSSELYLPFLDDGIKGNIAERLYWENAKRGHDVWGDALVPTPVAASAAGRAFIFHTEETMATASEPLPPLRFSGLVGTKVATLTALRRAQFESAQGRLAAAAGALGIADVVGAELLARTPQRPSLLPHLPKVEHHFLVADSAVALFAEDLAWQLGGAQLTPVGDGQEERIHLAWRQLLSGDRDNAELLLDSLDDAALASTTPMLIALGENQRAEDRLRKRIAANAKDALSLSALGSLLGNKGDVASLAEAGELFQAALTVDQNNPETWTRTGLVLIKQGKRDLAREAWTTALRLDPKRKDAAEFLRRLDAER